MITERQKQALELSQSGLSYRKVAKALGVSTSTAWDLINKGKKALLNELKPEGVPMAPVTGASLYFQATEDRPAGWWKMAFPKESRAFEDFVDCLCEKAEGKGKAPKRRERKTDRDDLLLEIAIPDAHVGMYAWKDETGDQDYDVDAAKNHVINSVYDICSRTRAKKGLLLFNGDTLHSDTRKNETELSGHRLDVDSRYNRVLEYVEAAIVESVKIACERCETVDLQIIPGNHDWHTAHCMSRILAAYFRNCENVHVEVNPNPRRAIKWGDVMLAMAHGDKINANQWAKIIPTQFPEIWGQTKRRYLHLGHIHHRKSFAPIVVDEQQGLVVEYLQSICPTDAYASEAGYVGTLKGAEGFLYTKQGIDTRWPMDR